ncbi:MAG: 3-isopropylmalate dehydratase small subunit, partial [Rhodospirillaceae bacterium]|nr:3-isopropylmalate dehydratase small subunit [Rhodospirillaceae bacterium]
IVTGPDGVAHAFDIDSHRRHRLLNGLDAVDYTLQFEAEMTAFEETYAESVSWLS